MYFDQFGKVRACCQNTYTYLGDVTEQTIRQVWESADAERLRSALERDDFSEGCGFCEWQVRDGNEEILFARQYDGLRPEERRPRWPRRMEFSLTNTCNLACVMCNGDWSSTIRSKREGLDPIPVVYGDEFFEQLAEFLPHLKEAAFLGGEPFLGKEPRRVMEMLAGLPRPPQVSITTNGTIFTRRVEQVLQALEPIVVVSVDGATKSTFESVRVGADFDAVIGNLDRFIDRLGPSRVLITHCLMTSNWWEFADLLRIAEKRGIGVGVNVVRFPAEQSLYQLPADELAGIVTTLRRTDASDLTAQRAMFWQGHLNALEHRLHTIEHDDGTLGPAHGLPGAPKVCTGNSPDQSGAGSSPGPVHVG